MFPHGAALVFSPTAVNNIQPVSKLYVASVPRMVPSVR